MGAGDGVVAVGGTRGCVAGGGVAAVAQESAGHATHASRIWMRAERIAAECTPAIARPRRSRSADLPEDRRRGRNAWRHPRNDRSLPYHGLGARVNPIGLPAS